MAVNKKETREKLGKLEAWFREQPGSIVAFSGGIDSSLLLFLARLWQGRAAAIGVISNSESLKRKDLQLARSFSQQFDIILEEIRTGELADQPPKGLARDANQSARGERLHAGAAPRAGDHGHLAEDLASAPATQHHLAAFPGYGDFNGALLDHVGAVTAVLFVKDRLVGTDGDLGPDLLHEAPAALRYRLQKGSRPRDGKM